jgi:hypothetical protein
MERINEEEDVLLYIVRRDSLRRSQMVSEGLR